MSQRISSPFGTVMLSESHHENVLERVFGEDIPEGPARNPRVPAVDVYETAEAYILLMDLPGVRKDDIDVKYSDGTLSISAEAKGLQRDDGHWIMHERRVGRYVRGVNLGRSVDPSSISAEFTDGILELTIRKPSGEATEAVDIAIG
ncbi:Hsp20/alpha crystallin family protein [Ruegeria sp.]|uniref:Hsp20/alpha crystallin family protein n=1 Tax=Ruegeria sp. TaxID=1879320 RepID=UPI002322EEC3|nr:Hsp20/alpha crystallin family protein [Ruegeria sp.]MDA7963619.1 Hsp20/alpha crystallin family protein [Ruegeria sp.]